MKFCCVALLYCIELLSKVKNVQECDATRMLQGTNAGSIEKRLAFILSKICDTPVIYLSAKINFTFAIFAANKKIMAATKITVNSNGSLKVEGDFEIVDKQGNVYDLGGREVVSICRCGLSQNKPFCDASHKGHFEHEAVAFALPPKKIV